jgi:hypothetical protein
MFFYTSQPLILRQALQWKSCAFWNRAIAGVCRPLSNAYLNFSNVNVPPGEGNILPVRMLRVYCSFEQIQNYDPKWALILLKLRVCFVHG